MSRRSWKQWFLKQFGIAKQSTVRRPVRRAMIFETLDQRITPAVNAFFSGGLLTITGDNNNNTIDVSRDAATPKQPGGETPADSACLLTIVRLLAKVAAHDVAVENKAK